MVAFYFIYPIFLCSLLFLSQYCYALHLQLVLLAVWSLYILTKFYMLLIKIKKVLNHELWCFQASSVIKLILWWSIYLLVPKLVQNEPAGRILELSILHLAMADISVLRTRHQIVINEVFCIFSSCFWLFLRSSSFWSVNAWIWIFTF